MSPLVIAAAALNAVVMLAVLVILLLRLKKANAEVEQLLQFRDGIRSELPEQLSARGWEPHRISEIEQWFVKNAAGHPLCRPQLTPARAVTEALKNTGVKL